MCVERQRGFLVQQWRVVGCKKVVDADSDARRLRSFRLGGKGLVVLRVADRT